VSAAWFDSHCHLFDCEGSPADALARARAAGVGEVLVAGIDEPSSENALRLASTSGVYAAVGVHPNAAGSWDGSRIDALDDLLGRKEAVAVGETGLDFHREDAPPERQRDAFRAHISLARAHAKALVIHTRASVDAVLDELENAAPVVGAVFHCWSGDSDQLARAVALGACISFAGNITFERNADLRALVGHVPSDRLLVETDSPYLTPVPHRGKPNEPAWLPLVGSAVARARGDSVERIARTTRANARRLFALEGR